MNAEKIMTLHVELGADMPVGRVPEGWLTIIPITGGMFEGPYLHGHVLPGGADWNTRVSPQISHACARYWIQTDDGAVISIHNEGCLRLDRNPDALCTTPVFRCDLDGPYSFLMDNLFAGKIHDAGERMVEIEIWQIG
jgi:hypothetical protein